MCVVPGLYKAAFAGHVCFRRHVYGGEEHVWDLVSAAAVTVRELSRKRHVQLVIRDVTKPTGRRDHFIKPDTHTQIINTITYTELHRHTHTHKQHTYTLLLASSMS